MSKPKGLLKNYLRLVLLVIIVAGIVRFVSSDFHKFWYILLVVMGFVIERMTGKRGLKWWASNGLLIYLFF